MKAGGKEMKVKPVIIVGFCIIRHLLAGEIVELEAATLLPEDTLLKDAKRCEALHKKAMVKK